MTQVTVDPQALEACVRDVLNNTAARAMCVLEPLRVRILNFPHPGTVQIDVPDFPQDPARGSHKVPLASEIFIEASDFREVRTPRVCKSRSKIHIRHL